MKKLLNISNASKQQSYLQFVAMHADPGQDDSNQRRRNYDDAIEQKNDDTLEQHNDTAALAVLKLILWLLLLLEQFNITFPTLDQHH